MRWMVFLVPLAALGTYLLAQDSGPTRVGEVPGGTINPQGVLVRPVGKTIEVFGRPVDAALGAGGTLLLVKDRSNLRVIDTLSFEQVQVLPSPGGASLVGLAVSADGTAYTTGSGNELNEYKISSGIYSLSRTIKLPNDSFPCGVTLSADGSKAYVCLSKKNQLGIVDLASGETVRTVDVGIAPFEVVVDGSTAYVSNIGGRRAREGDTTAPSAETETPVDERGVANTGTVSVVNLDSGSVIKHVNTGLHPTDLALVPKHSVVACANSNDDSVSLISTTSHEEIARISVKPDAELPFGSMPNGICASPDGSTLFVALAGNNAVAVVGIGNPEDPIVAGFIPTGWYPVATVATADDLFVVNNKGIGSRTLRRAEREGRNSHDHRASIQKVTIPNLQQLKDFSAQVIEDGKAPQILRAMERDARSDARPVPVPERVGEPSVFNHVIYVIKENRTYDQMFGDMPEGKGMPSLCMFPADIAPNHHALARRFGLLDNYYCNGVLSADGHSWATEGNVTPYLNRAFGGFNRSYTFGDDPITYSASGFVWDALLAAGLSFRNYGEFNYTEPPAGWNYQRVFEAWQKGEPIAFTHKIGVERVRRYSDPDCPGWNMVIPDQIRMDHFLEEWEKNVAENTVPNFMVVYLPQDHFGGGVTSRAHMADNDLALGRLVEAVSKTEYWGNTLIVVNEDDPQNGFDHVDGHRSICLVISAYSKQGTNSAFYNQTSVLHTILRIFGLPPLNQQIAMAPLMTECFNAEANVDPFEALPASVPLNETPAAFSDMGPQERHWRELALTVPIHRTGLKTSAHEDILNRAMWHEMRGEEPYPFAFAGPHGRGLAERKLILDPEGDED